MGSKRNRSVGGAGAVVGGCLLAALLAMGGTSLAQGRDALPEDAAVPALGHAHVLPMRPQARMLEDGETCELIAGILTPDGELLRGGVELYRGRSRRSFMRASTRKDGLIVAHFKADPNEVIFGRPYWFDMRDRSNRYGLGVSTTCLSGSASLGEPERLPSETLLKGT